MFEDLRGYVQMASGLTEMTATKAREFATGLLNQGMQLTSRAPDVVGQVQGMADELVASSKENREALIKLIRVEVDRSVGLLGFVREDELAALRRHVQRVEQQLLDLKVTRPAFPDAVKHVDDNSTNVDFMDADDVEEVVEQVESVEPKRKIILVQEDRGDE